MKAYVTNPKPPLQLFTQREDGIREEKAFSCGECGLVYSTSDSALYCCKQDVCEVCGSKVSRGWNKCSPCRYKIKWEKAVEVDFDGCVYCDATDRFFDDLGEAIDYFIEEDAAPEFLHPCYLQPAPRLNIDSALESMTEDIENGYDLLVGLDALYAAVEDFNVKQARLQTYAVDRSKKVRLIIPEEAVDGVCP